MTGIMSFSELCQSQDVARVTHHQIRFESVDDETKVLLNNMNDGEKRSSLNVSAMPTMWRYRWKPYIFPRFAFLLDEDLNNHSCMNAYARNTTAASPTPQDDRTGLCQL